MLKPRRLTSRPRLSTSFLTRKRISMTPGFTAAIPIMATVPTPVTTGIMDRIRRFHSRLGGAATMAAIMVAITAACMVVAAAADFEAAAAHSTAAAVDSIIKNHPSHQRAGGDDLAECNCRWRCNLYAP